MNQADPPQERPPAFTYRARQKSGRANGVMLHVDRVPAATLLHRFGTPLYVYSASAIRERVRTFKRAFRKFPHTICYSVKANSNLAILRLLARMGCGFDVVSGGELERVLIADRRASKQVVFSGVGKTTEEIAAALKAGILLFNVESESELAVLAECAARSKKRAQLALRVNPDVSAETHPYISTGLHKHKFGIPIQRACEIYGLAAKQEYLQVTGVSVHIGSQISDVRPFGETMERVAELVRRLRNEGHDIRYIDAGGGLGISYQRADTDFAVRVDDYARALLRPLRSLQVHLLLEPGRSLVAAAGALFTTVIYKKTNDGKKFLVVDAAMNDLLRPALYSAHHTIVPVQTNAAGGREIVDVVGPICETGDFFARDRELPITQEGDGLAILDAGAYGMVLASNYNTRFRPAEVLVDGKTAKLVRRRETIKDLTRMEQ